MGAPDLPFSFDLTSKQAYALYSPATEILYGGSAGGGKSHLMRVVLIRLCMEIPGLQCYLFRRITEDLHRNHVDGPKGLRALLAPLVNSGRCQITEDEVRFRHPGTGKYDTGSRIYLCHCKEEKHVYKYHGAEIHVLAMDELTHFTEFIYRYLRNRVRIVGLAIPDFWRSKLPLILNASNPGNVGHLWVKQAWIDGAEQYALRPMNAKEGGMLRQYIPATLDDNPYLETDDPGYENRLMGLGNEALVRAMRYGDWSVIAGAYFSMFERRRHVVRPFNPPIHWARFRAIDWGYAKPFSVGWYAVSDGRGPELANEDGERIWLPKGGLVRYREWYGQNPDEPPNTGVKMDIEDVAAGIVTRSKGEAFIHTTADPSMWEEASTHKMIGPSIAERAFRAGVKGMRKADNRRVLGWQQVAHRLNGEPDERTAEVWPMLLFTANCTHLIRTLPAMQHDEDDLEDINSDLEDHAADEVRYACMSRPRVIQGQDKKVYDPRAAKVLFPDMFEEQQNRSIYRY